MKWDNVKRLHIEISANCNASCPQCVRHPTNSYFLNPMVKETDSWTYDDVKKYLPLSDLSNLKFVLYNGTIGDFITNNDAIEIARYLASANENVFSVVNTNGSARNSKWWQELASIPRLKVNFAIDGLEDTHHLYRRNTDFSRIIENAKTFIAAGGQADWHMIVFDHNKHQIEECRELSKQLGFKKFHFRYTDRPDSIVRDRAGNFEYEIRAIKKDGTLRNSNKLSKQEIDRHIVRTTNHELQLLNNTYRPQSEIHNINKPLESLNDCESLRDSAVYIASNWAVAPCCFIGSIFINKHHDRRYNNLLEKMKAENINFESYIAKDGATIKDIVNNVGFDWIYDKLLSNPLNACYTSCHVVDSRYKQMWNENISITNQNS